MDVEPVKLDVKFGNMYTREVESFSDSILKDKPIEVSGEIGLHVQEVIDKAYQAAKRNLVIEL